MHHVSKNSKVKHRIAGIYLREGRAQNLTNSWNQAGEETWLGIQFFGGVANTTAQNTTKNVS